MIAQLTRLNWPLRLGILVCCVFLETAAWAQEKQMVQVRTFDERLQPLGALEVSINGGAFVQLDKKGNAFIELEKKEPLVNSVLVKDPLLEPASWNYSKGILEIVLRKKSYRVVKFNFGFSDRTPLIGAEVIFKGQAGVSATTDAQGNAELPIPLQVELNSDQIEVVNHKVTGWTKGDVIHVVVERPLNSIPFSTQPKTAGAELPSLSVAKIDSARSLRSLLILLQDQAAVSMSDIERRKLNSKINELINTMRDSLVKSNTYIQRISGESYINDDIRNLLSQASAEDQQLSMQREEFTQKIRLIEEKLEKGMASLTAEARNQLLSDLNALQKVLSENESRFYKSHDDYNAIINNLKEKYFDIEQLETRLSESEAQRAAEQQRFQQRLFAISGVIIVLALLIITLVYFSGRLRKQKRALSRANEEISRMNETLEEMVQLRTVSLEQANQELDAFLYRASHDLRSPLCSIKGLVYISQYLTKNELVEKMGDTIVGMDRLLKKLEDVSELADVDESAEISLGYLINDIADRFAEAIKEKNIDFEIRCDSTLTVRTDFKVLEAIVFNLIENAVFFSSVERAHQPRVEVSVRVTNSDLEIQVFDNGIGVEESIRPKIYQMFYKGHVGSKGSGLGLYIVDKGVQALKGSMEMETEVGAFTRFTIKLPVHSVNVRESTMASLAE